MRDFNFFSSFLGEKKDSKTKYVMGVATIASLVFFIGGTYLWSFCETNKFEKEMKEMKKYLNDPNVISSIKKVDEYKNKTEIMKKQYASIEGIVVEMNKKDVVSSVVLKEVTAVVPQNLGFKNLMLQGEEVQLQGIAKDRVSIAEFQYNLKTIDRVKEVQVLNITKVIEKSEEYMFTLKCTMKAGGQSEIK